MSHSLGYCMSTSFSDLESATIVTQFTVVPFLLFSGFLLFFHNMAGWIGWIQYLSPLRYSIEAMLKNEFINNKKAFLNADEEYGMNLGFLNCLLCLFLIGTFLRIVEGVLLKLLVRKTG